MVVPADRKIDKMMDNIALMINLCANMLKHYKT